MSPIISLSISLVLARQLLEITLSEYRIEFSCDSRTELAVAGLDPFRDEDELDVT